MIDNFLAASQKQFKYYKALGDKTFEQLSDAQLFFQPNPTCNSISILVNHLHGNMMSRWTNFLTEDGEKSWRNRDHEFEDEIKDRASLLRAWEEGWSCLFEAMNQINTSNFDQIIYIRNQGHSITEAVLRQQSHYAYHVGQIVYIGKLLQDESWQSLSIPKGQSDTYNKAKFDRERSRTHFTNEYIDEKR